MSITPIRYTYLYILPSSLRTLWIDCVLYYYMKLGDEGHCHHHEATYSILNGEGRASMQCRSMQATRARGAWMEASRGGA